MCHANGKFLALGKHSPKPDTDKFGQQYTPFLHGQFKGISKHDEENGISSIAVHCIR